MKQGTFSKDKHEILFQRFNINYDKEDEVWKKGSVVYRKVGTGTIFRSLDANND
jgi:tRNA(His) 5'-end guanylyltransferase